jgi:hypothetical protein
MRGRNPIPFDRNPLAMLIGAIVVVVGVLAAIVVVGLGGVFHFLFSFLLPMALILFVVVGTIGLAVQGGAKVLDSRDQPSSTNVRNHPRGGVLSSPVYWLLMSLFFLASVAMACFFWLVIRDQWIHHRLLVAGRFDEGETLRVVFVPLETVFMAAFTLCAALAAVTVLPALFAG